MKKLFGRIGAILIALLFLVTSLGFSILVIWQQHQQDHQNQQQANLQKTLQQAQSQQSQSQQPKEGKLAGTQLQNFTPVSKVDKLQTTDMTVGTGAEVKSGDTVTVNYTGALAKNGIIFESSLDSGQAATFGLDQVIKGWTDGIPGMKVGGTRRLLIPAAEAYGSQGKGNIPADSDLVFDVTLIKIGQ